MPNTLYQIASVSSTGPQGNGGSYSSTMSADGRFVAYLSFADNLVAGDTNSAADVFVFDRATGESERISVSSEGMQGTADAYGPLSISADGRFVSFTSYADNLVPGDTNSGYDVFVYDRSTGTTERISAPVVASGADGAAHHTSMSADGRFVAFMSSASNLVAGDTNSSSDIFVFDRKTKTMDRVSLTSGATPVQANNQSQAPSISGDGRFVAFESFADNLVAGDTNGTSDIFVYDRVAKTVARVSLTEAGGQRSDTATSASISADGRYVAYAYDTHDPLDPMAPGYNGIAVYDRWAGITRTLAAPDPFDPMSTVLPDGNSFAPKISANGRYVIFESDATNLVGGDANGQRDVFVWDLSDPFNFVRRVSVSATGAESNGFNQQGGISADGSHVAFTSHATNLVPGDANATFDVFANGDERFSDSADVKTLTGHRVGRTQIGDFAAAGGGNDRITGSQRADTILGQAGDDTLKGRNGNDTLSGGTGSDRLDGGAGSDTALFTDSIGDVVANLLLHKATTVGDGLDVLIAIENLTGGAFNDTLTGTNGVNVLQGGGGADKLYGLAGNDTLAGGSGANLLDGGAGIDTADYTKATSGLVVDLANGWAVGGDIDDTLVAIEVVRLGMGDDVVMGTTGADTIAGNGGNDDLFGFEGADNLQGGAGDDELDGGLGADLMSGGSGNDTYFVDIAGDKVIEAAGEGIDTVYAAVDHVLAGNVENLILEEAAAKGTGNALDNEITGNDLANTLLGMDGADILMGSGGNDTLTGGKGNDVFVFSLGDGKDVITDFTAGAGIADRLDVTGIFKDFAGLLAASKQVGADVVISFGSEDQVTLKGVLLANLNADDLII